MILSRIYSDKAEYCSRQDPMENFHKEINQTIENPKSPTIAANKYK